MFWLPNQKRNNQLLNPNQTMCLEVLVYLREFFDDPF